MGFMCKDFVVAESAKDFRGVTQHFMACGKSRALFGIPEATKPVQKPITVQDLLDWMGSSLASRWEPYGLVLNNCQHFQAELQVTRLSRELNVSRFELADLKSGAPSKLKSPSNLVGLYCESEIMVNELRA